MAAKKPALGRGLDSLFADTTGGVEAASPSDINISEIQPDKSQPRKKFDQTALEELAESIREHGVLQPLLIRPMQDGMGYQIVAGERRWRAAKLAGLTEVPTIIKELTEREAAELALVENLQREDLGPVEEAKGYQNLAENYGLTQDEIAKRVGKSRPVVANALRLLGLAPEVLDFLEDGKITTGHAKVLLSLEDKAQQLRAATVVVEQKLSVRETEKLLKKLKSGMKAPRKEMLRPVLPQEVEIILQEALGTKVKVSSYKQGKGVLQIEFNSDDELRLYAKKLGE